MTTRRQKPNILLLLGWNDSEAIEAIGDCARERGWHLELRPYFTGTVPGNWNGDGILYSKGIPKNYQDEFVIRQATRCPVVALNANLPEGLDIPVVTADNREAGRMAALHLIEQGCRDFAFESPVIGPVATERQLGFEETVRAHGLRLHGMSPPIVSKQPVPWDAQRRRLETWLRNLPEKVGVLALDDLVAADLIEVAVELGRRVPEDIAVVGLGNLKAVCQYSPIPITSIDLRPGEAARQAAELLGRLMAQDKNPGAPPRVAPGSLIVRESSDTTLVRDPRLAKSVAYIRANLDKSLSVDQIAEAGGISRRTLYLLFDDNLGLTPTEYLRRKRTQRADRLLREQPDLARQEVARLSGFACTRTFDRSRRRG